MDIRQIQALHAQYTPQPVVIDIADHKAAMPALPAPERGARRKWKFHAMTAKLKKAGRPALVCVAIAALAGGGGMSAAKIWRVMHDSVAAPAHPVEQVVTASAQASVASESAINFAPARPLTASDFGHQPGTASALASVDARSLSIDAPKAGSTGSKPSDSATDSTLARAAASSIHAQRPAVSAQSAVAPTIAPTPTATPTQPATVAPAAPIQSRAQPLPQTQRPAAPVTSPAIVRAASNPQAPAPKPAFRPIRHVTSHHVASTAAEAPSTPPAAQQSAPATKGGDVQLF